MLFCSSTADSGSSIHNRRPTLVETKISSDERYSSISHLKHAVSFGTFYRQLATLMSSGRVDQRRHTVVETEIIRYIICSLFVRSLVFI